MFKNVLIMQYIKNKDKPIWNRQIHIM